MAARPDVRTRVHGADVASGTPGNILLQDTVTISKVSEQKERKLH